MPKFIPREQYLTNPFQLVPPAVIYPDIQKRPDALDTSSRILPAVFEVEKGDWFTVSYPGPGIVFVHEGELKYEDKKNPGRVAIIGAGGVLHVEQGDVVYWCSPSSAKGIAVVWAPASVTGYESFVVPGKE